MSMIGKTIFHYMARGGTRGLLQSDGFQYSFTKYKVIAEGDGKICLEPDLILIQTGKRPGEMGLCLDQTYLEISINDGWLGSSLKYDLYSSTPLINIAERIRSDIQERLRFFNEIDYSVIREHE